MARSVIDLKRADTPRAEAASSPLKAAEERSPAPLRTETSGEFAPLSWDAPLLAGGGKSFAWQASVIVITSGVMVAMVVLENYTAAVFFAVAALVVLLSASSRRQVISFGIDGRGVRAGDRLFIFDDLRSFWIFYEPGVRAELSLRSRKVAMPYIHIPLGEMNPARVHEALSRYIPERRQQDSVVDHLSRHLGL